MAAARVTGTVRVMVPSLRPRGFTLVELQVILVVCAILAALGVYAYTGLYGHAREGRALDVLAHVTAGEQANYANRGVFVALDPTRPDDDSAVQAVAEHEPGYTTADTAGDELVVSLGVGATAEGVPYVAVATTLGATCAMRVAYPTRSGLPARTLTTDAGSSVCTAAEAAARLAG